MHPTAIHRRATLTAVLAAACCAAPAARADVFDGRIAFGSFRVDPPAGQTRSGDIFTINPDGTDLRRLTTNPDPDRQPDWSPTGTDIAYSIRKPGGAVNFEVARMTAAGKRYQQLTTTESGQASSQPSWAPSGKSILFRRSGPGLVASIWQMGLHGESPMLRFGPPHPPLYPSWSPDMSKILFTAIMSPAGDTDRGIFTVNADGSGLTTLFDMPESYDSAPAWSPDGRRIAFESNSNPTGANPEGDLEIWTMAADGSDVRQLTSNALHDEGPAWSPDGGRYIAYTSGVDDTHGDINVMTASGVPVRRLTDYPGLDESPDWQSIPAPTTARRRCTDAPGYGVHDVRAGGSGLRCPSAVTLAVRWTTSGRPHRISRFAVRVGFFGGTRRIVMTRRKHGVRQVVAFVFEQPA